MEKEENAAGKHGIWILVPLLFEGTQAEIGSRPSLYLQIWPMAIASSPEISVAGRGQMWS
jgi:hypothetical protein